MKDDHSFGRLLSWSLALLLAFEAYRFFLLLLLLLFFSSLLSLFLFYALNTVSRLLFDACVRYFTITSAFVFYNTSYTVFFGYHLFTQIFFYSIFSLSLSLLLLGVFGFFFLTPQFRGLRKKRIVIMRKNNMNLTTEYFKRNYAFVIYSSRDQLFCLCTEKNFAHQC